MIEYDALKFLCFESSGACFLLRYYGCSFVIRAVCSPGEGLPFGGRLVSSRLVVSGGGGGEKPRFQIFGRAVCCRKWLSVGASGIIRTVLARSIEWYTFLMFFAFSRTE
jgi:hypothetical protein